MESTQGCFSVSLIISCSKLGNYVVRTTWIIWGNGHTANTTQAEPSHRPAYYKELLSLQLCLESSHWKFKERVREKGRRCPAGDASALKMTSVSVVLTMYVFTWAGRKTAEANRKCWQPQFWVWECGYCFLLPTWWNSSNKPKGVSGAGKATKQKTPKLFSFFFLNYKNSIWLV